jgi:transcriptional regulator GlxA family with amidase domain
MLICFFVLPGGEALEFAGPSDVFEEANRQAGRRVYDIRFVAEEPQLITCLSGLRVMPDRTIHDADEPIDTLIVAGVHDDDYGGRLATTTMAGWGSLRPR